MFAQKDRLPRADFEAVLKTGRRLSSTHFLVVFSEKAKGYAVIIPKKVVRLSVDRHRLKRQVLEVLREFPLPPALVVFPRAVTDSVNYQDIRVELGELLSKIKN